MNETTPLYVRISNDLDDELQAVIEREKRSKTTIVISALEDYIAKSKAEAEVQAVLARRTTPTAA